MTHKLWVSLPRYPLNCKKDLRRDSGSGDVTAPEIHGCDAELRYYNFNMPKPESSFLGRVSESFP